MNGVSHSPTVWILRSLLSSLFLLTVVNGWTATTTITTTTTSTTPPHYRDASSLTTRLNAATAATTSDSDTKAHPYPYQHTMAILTMPSTSTEKIANEAILNQAVEGTRKLSVVLRANEKNPSLARLRQYVGEVYSTLWDVAMSHTADEGNGNGNGTNGNGNGNGTNGNGNAASDGSYSGFCDVVVYPQNLPNAAPEQWIYHAPDLDSVCSHDSICGWISESALGRGLEYQSKIGDGVGGLEAHVMALNADRTQRDLSPVQAIHVHPWPMGASTAFQEDNHVAFLDDEEPEDVQQQQQQQQQQDSGRLNGGDDTASGEDGSFEDSCQLIGGVRVPSGCLFEQVAVGGTFDGMHYGHRKLLTLAVSSVNPVSGKLLIGVTIDEMLRHKAYADQIPTLQERMDGARDFIYRLAPGIKNRVKLFAISDEYGPPGTLEDGKDFDALVLSHETLENGYRLNQHRIHTLGLPPLTLLCTRRTEPHGMSSTALRRRAWEQQQRKTSAPQSTSTSTSTS